MLKDCYISLQQLDSIANNIIRIFNLVHVNKLCARLHMHTSALCACVKLKIHIHHVLLVRSPV